MFLHSVCILISHFYLPCDDCTRNYFFRCELFLDCYRMGYIGNDFGGIWIPIIEWVFQQQFVRSREFSWISATCVLSWKPLLLPSSLLPYQLDPFNFFPSFPPPTLLHFQLLPCKQ
ncbi:hypothetical protein HYC85_015487 [Camellia sinensis]|uniref:Uncharacterized protein n=1 Tax=Camellia sinensis TaxID=4442 RepID=A0A7J7GX23_CAMSI|nr:hypothetical protein HYC85_015487 [Camellia sinensis]